MAPTERNVSPSALKQFELDSGTVVFSFTLAICCILLPSTSLAEMKKDIVYAKRGEQELRLNLALPDSPGTMRPAVICIHGGAWQSGRRQSYDHLIEALAYRGYVAATIDYRLTGIAPWPAQLDDVKAAYAWLVDHADDYGIEIERIAAVGDSAGGHLALLLGTLPSETTNRRYVRGVINYFGPTDLQPAKVQHALDAVEPLVGGKVEDHAALLKQISPLTHIDRTDAPVLTFHGTEDRIVPFDDHAVPLNEALVANKVPHHLEKMIGAGHAIGRDRDRYNKLFADFVLRYLKGSRLPLLVHEDFDAKPERWKLSADSQWQTRITNSRSFLSVKGKDDKNQPSNEAPQQIALMKETKLADFVFDIDMRSTEDSASRRNLCLVFNYQDPDHFYFAQLSRNPEENAIFAVNGAAPIRISTERDSGTDWSRGWHRVRLVRDGASGKANVFFDDMKTPVMSAVDRTLAAGAIGFGSNCEAGDFDAVRVYAKTD